MRFRRCWTFRFMTNFDNAEKGRFIFFESLIDNQWIYLSIMMESDITSRSFDHNRAPLVHDWPAHLLANLIKACTSSCVDSPDCSRIKIGLWKSPLVHSFLR
jgi:hypothetical protein